jgi:CD63 antigen
MSDLSGGAKCVKYTLFIFNLLFLLAGLALIIVGAVVQVQANNTLAFGSSTSSAAIFIIIIGSIVFLVSFFGCAGAINNNYCMVVTYGVLLLLLLLAQIAGVITGFVMRDKIQATVLDVMKEYQKEYTDQPDNVATQTWNQTQRSLKCCGTDGYQSWNISGTMSKTHSVPDSCCKNETLECGYERNIPSEAYRFYDQGCSEIVADILKQYLVYVGAVTAAVAFLELIGIIFAFCLANSLRKDYRVV